MAEKNQAAVALGRRRFSGMNEEQMREHQRLAASARWAIPTNQDKRVRQKIQEVLASKVHEAIDSLFRRLQREGKPRALVIHGGEAWVIDPTSRDYRLLEQKHPEAVVGIYDRNSTRLQVLEDVREILPGNFMPAVARAEGVK